MSHFSVLIRLPAETRRENFEAAIGRLMDPYCEHTDDGRLSRFHEFVDTEDEYRSQWETGSVEMVRLPDGELVLPWDQKFKKAARFFLEGCGFKLDFMNDDGGKEGRAKLREAFEHVDVPHHERFSSLEEFAKTWHGKDRDSVKSRYGYWANPRAKWDYWRVGGRWRGNMYVKKNDRLRLVDIPGKDREHPVDAGLADLSWEFKPEYMDGKVPPGSETEVDWCRIRDLDFPRIERESRERADRFWAEVDTYLSGKKFDAFEGPRETMMALGMLECRFGEEIQKKPLTGGEFRVEEWGEPPRLDVIERKPSREEWDARVIAHVNPVRPWAFLDAGGWRERGRVGMFGFADDTPDSNAAFVDGFDVWLRGGDQADWLVTVDCHI